MKIDKIYLSVFLLLTACGGNEPSAILIRGCGVDVINDSLSQQDTFSVSRADKNFKVTGWVADVDAKTPIPKDVSLVIIGSEGVVINLGSTNDFSINRPDLVKVYNKIDLEKAGFVLSGFVDSVPNGKYSIQLNAYYDGFVKVCSTEKQLIVN